MPKEIVITNAKIINEYLGYEDHGLLTSSVTLDYGDEGGCQGFGMYNLAGKACALWIKNILKVCEVLSWDKVKDCHVRVEHEPYGKIYKIGHITKDIWFDPSVDLKEKQDA